MIPESRAIQRPPKARLLAIDALGRLCQIRRADFPTLLWDGDLVIANDAATLPASLPGIHVASGGGAIEVRLAGWPSAVFDDPRRFHAIVFGPGDYCQRTEDRPPPPVLRPGDRLALGPLSARIEALLGHSRFATLTHAAGISSTGDPELDNLLPFDEPYSIPATTATTVNAARADGGRVIAIGTTVVRALEAAGSGDGIVRGGNGVATGGIGAGTRLRVVDAILTGTHEPGTGHHALLGAFLDEMSLRQIDAELNDNHYRTHEFGDSLFIVRGAHSTNGRASPASATSNQRG